MNPKIILLLSLLPFLIPFVISIGAIFGIIPLSAGISPRLPIIFAFGSAFLLSVVIWKWRSPEIQAKFSASSASKIEKAPARNLLLFRILLIILFTFLGISAGLFILNAGQIQISGVLFMALSLLGVLLSSAALIYTKKVRNMAAKSSLDGSSQEGRVGPEGK